MEEKQKKKHAHAGHRQRVKDKAIEAGIEHWPIHEVLELLLMYAIPQKDVNPLAHELIDTFGSISGVLDAGFEQLQEIKGIGKDTALFLSMLPDVFSRYTASKNVGSVCLDIPERTVSHFRSIDQVKNVENCYVFCLNSSKKLIKTIKFNSPLSSAISISKTLFAQKIAFGANKAIIILHTHPNGVAEPTEADVNVTKQLIKSAATLGIKVDDHVIVTNRTFYSFLKSGMLEGIKSDLGIDDNEIKKS